MEDSIDMEKLILAIEKQPAIWNIGSAEYADRLKRKKSWEEITNLFSGDCTKEEKQIMGTLIQKKWKNARDRYTRDMNYRVGAKTPQGVKRKAPYMFAPQMSFLHDTVHRSSSSSTVNNENETSLPSDEDLKAQETVVLRLPQKNNVTECNRVIPDMDKSGTENASSTIKKKEKKKEIPLVEAKLIEALEYNAKRRVAREKNEEDDDRLFLLSLLPHLKQLPAHVKLCARMDILQAVNKHVMQSAMISQDQQVDFDPYTQTEEGSEDVKDILNNPKTESHSDTGSPPPLSPTESVHTFNSNYSDIDCDVKPF